MQEINEELENDRSVLEWMLGQYVRASILILIYRSPILH